MSVPYSDIFDTRFIPADPIKRAEMKDDCREAHEWVSRQLANATEQIRIFNLTQERKRLAGIYAAILQPPRRRYA